MNSSPALIVITVSLFRVDRTRAVAPVNRYSNHYEAWALSLHFRKAQTDLTAVIVT